MAFEHTNSSLKEFQTAHGIELLKVSDRVLNLYQNLIERLHNAEKFTTVLSDAEIEHLKNELRDQFVQDNNCYDMTTADVLNGLDRLSVGP